MWHWYVEEFAPAEQHRHAIEEVYYSGRSEGEHGAVRNAEFKRGIERAAASSRMCLHAIRLLEA
jgi:hypothetical protein